MATIALVKVKLSIAATKILPLFICTCYQNIDMSIPQIFLATYSILSLFMIEMLSSMSGSGISREQCV